MKTRSLFRIFICGLCAASICWAQEKSALPLPDSGQVTLPLDEYNKLVELAGKPPKKLDVAPLPYSIKHADLKLRVENNGIKGSVELQGEVFRKGIIKVPLTSGMTVLDAHQGGKGVPLVQENGRHAALLTGPGDFSVALDAGLPLRIDAGRASFSLPVPSAGSVQLALVIPGDRTVANISPGLITGRKSENGHTTIEATLVPGQIASISWATREVAAPAAPREVRFLADEKTLISFYEAEMRVAVLADINVLQGDPSQFQLQLPEGYELTGVTGATLDSSEAQGGILTLKVNAPGQRGHQFLISMERALHGTTADAPFLSFKGAQRETGEVLVEGSGTIEITATEGGGLKRMDVKEANPYLRSLAHFPPQAAFRYHRQPGESPTLAFNSARFPDGSVLGAVAESADITTLVTSEGKSLTEVRLTLKNQAKPFLKVSLPAGATILSADVAGERVKPVQASDGNRVPLLRPGFRPTDSYTISFVFLHSGAPFARKGGADLILPSMDIPIAVLHWELFLPDRYKVKDFGGDVIAASAVPSPFLEETAIRGQRIREAGNQPMNLQPGQMGGVVTDPSGAVVPNAQVTVTGNGMTRSTVTDSMGKWLIAGMPSGTYQVKLQMPGFRTAVYNMDYKSNQLSAYNFSLELGTTAETVAITAQSGPVQTENAGVSRTIEPQEARSLQLNGRNYSELIALSSPGVVNQSASANVMNLQKRVAGVLPVAIEVPKAGTSFSFVRPLVLDEETKVTFTYKSR